MNSKTKTFLGISLVILCLFAATLFMTACSNSETENNTVVPQSTPNTTLTDSNATEKPITSPGSNHEQENVISKDAAKKIVLDHAKVSEADAKKFKSELDYEDGIRVYEIEFESAGFEYDYDINAITGEIIKSNKERD